METNVWTLAKSLTVEKVKNRTVGDTIKQEKEMERGKKEVEAGKKERKSLIQFNHRMWINQISKRIIKICINSWRGTQELKLVILIRCQGKPSLIQRLTTWLSVQPQKKGLNM